MIIHRVVCSRMREYLGIIKEIDSWTVVGVIVALVGLFVTVGAPIIRLNGNIARSNVILDRLEKELAAQKMDAKESHRRLWKHNDEQDERIGDHETRITILENR